MISGQSARPILMTADPIGGVWSYARELCRTLARAGRTVCLATMGRRLTAAERAEFRSIPTVEIFESDFRLEWMEEPWRDVDRAGEWLLELQSRLRPSVIHLNGYAHGAIRWDVPCLIVGHSCVFSWFEAVRYAAPPADWQCYREAVTAGLRGASVVTAPSRFMLEQLKSHYGSFTAVEPIYNGRTGAEFPPGRKEPLVLTAGRLWDPAKNVLGLARIASKIAWPIYAAGSVSAPDGRKVSTEGLYALGQLDVQDLSRWYSRAAIFALPARYEPFGLSILEAALAGCSLVLGDIPSLREIWREAALFVAPDDPVAIAAAVNRLIGNAALRRDQSARARARGLELTPERMTRAYLALYARLEAQGDHQDAELLIC